jgi:hypothetical protein
MNSDLMPQVIGEHEAAKILGKSVQTLRNERYLRKGSPYIKMGRSVRYRVDDLLGYLEKCRIDPEGLTQDKISEIKNAADIVDIVSEGVLLKRAGKNYIGLCPFHSEKTPSFTVSPDKQIFHCFGCGTGGNVFNFLMKQEGLSFPEAAGRLAKRYSV